MKFKEYIQQQADKDDEKLLTESDLQFCAQLAEDVQERPLHNSKMSKTKFWAALSSAVAVVLLAVIILPFAFANKPVDDVYYKEENIVNRECSLEELNSGLNNFIIEQSEFYDLKIRLFYDSESSNSLYYEIINTGLISDFNLIIVVNRNYHFNFDLDNEPLKEQLSDYSVEYLCTKSNSLTDMGVGYKGKIQLNEEVAYIEYKQVVDLGEQAFFDDIQSVLKAKG